MLNFFERLINPFPPEHPTQPPDGPFQFCRHYIRGIERYLVIMAILTIAVAVGEAMLYGVLGTIIDWLSEKNPNSFLQEEYYSLVGLSIFILVLMPLLVIAHSLVMYQTLMGNLPMIIRWQAHRYLINQSYAFFQNEFSGRIATKVMQTALAVRETVMKTIDVLLFVSVYFVTTLYLIASADFRLCLPLFFWLCIYFCTLYFFIPRLKDISKRQADARSVMTGRIVDSYTNILTLKLFSHTHRESEYVKSSMVDFLGTVHPQMRLVTWLHSCVWSNNMLLVFCIGGLGIYLWIDGNITIGAIAVALSLAIRLTGMSHWVMWEISALFENIGIVQDGIDTLSKPHTVTDVKDAALLTVKSGSIHFKQVSFSYQPNLQNEVNQQQIFKNFDLTITAGEKVGIVGPSGAGKSTLVNLLLRFYDVHQGNIYIDEQDISLVTQESLRAYIAIVTQDTSLLHRSIRDNLLFGKPDATDKQLLEASRLAHAHEFITTLIDSKGRSGYDAVVGERGVNL